MPKSKHQKEIVLNRHYGYVSVELSDFTLTPYVAMLY
jgi:hypothetical protein